MKYFKMSLLILFAIICFIGCSDKNPKIEDEISETIVKITVTPTVSLVEENIYNEEIVTSIPDESIHDGLFPIVDVGYEVSTENINYYNYINQMPLVVISEWVYEFNNGGFIEYTDNLGGENKSFHLTDKIVNMKDYLNENIYIDKWYFMGVIHVDNYLYMHYDYIGESKQSFLFRMDLTCDNISICIMSNYNEDESLNCFTVTKDCIYYTYVTNSGLLTETSIIETDLDGTNPRILCSFESGNTIRYLYPEDSSLYFICTDNDGKQSLYRSKRSDLSLSIVLKNCVTDFLYIYEDRALLNVSNDTYLNYFDLKESKYYKINLTGGLGVRFSVPFMAEDDLYVAVYTWEDETPTELALLDFSKNKVDEFTILSNNYYHSIGMIGNILYAEDGKFYKAFDVTTKSEVPIK